MMCKNDIILITQLNKIILNIQTLIEIIDKKNINNDVKKCIMLDLINKRNILHKDIQLFF
jgi:hypothetical protein